ncbi:hypothetical protein [Paenibacillus sp. NPDC057934]|uniref:hypothetical protein n=1 Tax=Paenibacillus sp. NPDC057934 TaxID=3346282 RepID=UPI0036D97D40
MNTETKELLNDFAETEQKLAYKMLKKKKDLQLLASNGIESYAFLDNTKLEQFNLITGYIGRGKKVCHVSHAGNNYPYIEGTGVCPVRVWVDCMDKSNINFHINIGGDFINLSNSQEVGETDELLIVFLQCPDFVQFSVFDGRVAYQKVGHIFTSSKLVMDKMRTIALSMLELSFSGLNELLLQLEDDFNEEI